MAIDHIKEFFKRRKADTKFARAGTGKTLASEATSSEQAGPSTEQSSARQAAAEAAIKRFNKDAKPAQKPRLAALTSSRPAESASTSTTKEPEPAPEPARPTELVIVDGEAQRDVQIYSTEDLSQRVKQPELDDDFFRLNIEDAKMLKQRYDEERARNETLKTSEMRKRESESKKSTTNLARLRLRLPNDMLLEASFSGGETLNQVREWLTSSTEQMSNLVLKDFDILMGHKPFKSTDYEKSLRELGLLPATTLTIMHKPL